MSTRNLPLEVAEMKILWLEMMEEGGKMRYLLQEIIGHHSERCEIILNNMHGDKRVQKAIKQRRGHGLIEENALLDMIIKLKELQKWGFSNGQTTEAKELYSSTFNKTISELEQIGIKYSTLIIEWTNYLWDLLDCYEQGKQDINRSYEFKIQCQNFADAWFIQKWGAESQLLDWQLKKAQTAYGSAAMLDIDNTIHSLEERIKKVNLMREAAELSFM